MDDNTIRPDEPNTKDAETSDADTSSDEKFKPVTPDAVDDLNDTPSVPEAGASPSQLSATEEPSALTPAGPTEGAVTPTPDSDNSEPPKPVTPVSAGHTAKQVNARALTVTAIVGVLMIIAACFGGYVFGKHSVKPVASNMTTATSAVSMEVPKGATVIEQCEPGLGMQYIMPKDIPNGPVYDVYQGKLIGIEYMADLASMEKLNTMMNNLPLFGQKYDHVNIMSMAAHGGFPTPHYQVDAMMVPKSVTDKITCGGSSDMSMPMSSTPTSTPAPKSSSSDMKM